MLDMDDMLQSLNDMQRKAVTLTEGYVRVIAGAGTGKTKALTQRYAYLVEELGISPSNILCITFTNKAASEMKARIKKILGEDADTSMIATLHSFCVRVLREDISKLFYPENFIVLDNADQKLILEEVYDELEIHMDTSNFHMILERVRMEKNLLKYLDYISNVNFDFQTLQPQNLEEKIVYRYIEKQKKQYALDFSDLINFTIYLFEKYPAILEKWQERLYYVQVDEMQDITVKEFNLIRQLTNRHKNWFVVGDPDQNIYEWRGSKMSVLLDFADCMKPCTDVILNENYRSRPEILRASNSLIEKNRYRIKKDLVTQKASSQKPVYFHAKNEKEEMKFIVDHIKHHIENGGKYNDIAVLFRSSYISRFIEQGFMEAGIPYMMYGGIGFYERKEIKDVIAYMRMVAYADNLSLKRILNVPRRKIGKIKMDFIMNQAEQENLSYYEVLKKYIDHSVFKGSKAYEFVETIERLREKKDNLNVTELLQRILVETRYEAYIRESGDLERLDNITEFLHSLSIQEVEFGEPLYLDYYLQTLSLFREREDENQKEHVKLMTIHTSKGLEFHTVFLIGMNEHVFPSKRALEERKEEALEEERRLCFVAMTRAMETLYFTESEGTGMKGMVKAPSRFLFEIAPEAITWEGDIPEELKWDRQQQRKGFSAPANRYKQGEFVTHKVFGLGEIKKVDERSRTYYIQFAEYKKPISFDYKGLSKPDGEESY